MSAVRPSAEARALLALRRSANKLYIGEPGPSPEEVDELLRVAARVPDHRRLEPWRFIVFEGDNRIAFGQQLARIAGETGREVDSNSVLDAAGLLLRAPVVIAVISSPVAGHKTPVWEQHLSAGAACQTLLLAANAAGWAGVWITEWIAYSAEVAKIMGLGEQEQVAGFIYLGTAKAQPQERARPDLAERIRRWTPA
jgi:nitroreductase